MAARQCFEKYKNIYFSENSDVLNITKERNQKNRRVSFVVFFKKISLKKSVRQFLQVNNSW